MNASITIEGATFVDNDVTGRWIRRFTISKDGKEIEIRISGRDKNHLEELHQELNTVWSFNPGDLVDVVIRPVDWSVDTSSGTLYYLESIKKGS